MLTGMNIGLTKAEYAVGYFTEMGIGCRRDPLEANVWYVRAAEAGDERAKLRLQAIRAAAEGRDPELVFREAKKGKKEKKEKSQEKKVGKKPSRLDIGGRKASQPVMNDDGDRSQMPPRSSSLPSGAHELQLPMSPNGEKATTPGKEKDKDCVVM